MATVRLSGGPALSYQEWGRPDGSVVLLLHGLESSSQSWRHVAPALGERFRVIAPDARGHGDSDWTQDYSFDLMRDDVIGLMEQLGILGAIVVGHSMGALTAFALAAARPELVRLLVLEEMPPPDPAKPAYALPRQPDPTGRTDWRAVIAHHRWRNAPHPDWWEAARQIPAKTLVLSGERSHLPQHRLKDLSHRIPHAEFVSLDRGHCIHEERPSDFLMAVQPFISWFGK